MIKLGAEQLRKYEPTKEEIAAIKRNDIFIIIDNVLDTFNVGSIFRLADAVAARKIFLVGESVTPDDPKVGHRIQKASVGIYRWVPWEKVETVGEAIDICRGEVHLARNLGNQGDNGNKGVEQARPLQIAAIEQAEGSVDYQKADLQMPVALIVGHETRGVSSEGLKLADQIVELPLYGVNKSLNVLVALSIICYKIVEKLELKT